MTDEAPEVIFLQTWEHEVTWCEDRIDSMHGEVDVEYVRKDISDGLVSGAWDKGFDYAIASAAGRATTDDEGESQ